MMNLLAIDTSTELATVALAVGGKTYHEEQNNIRQHAQFLLPIIERLLTKAQVSFKQLDGIVFGRGPGSFTGLRIACSVAKGLAYAHELPLYPVSSLAAIAYDAHIFARQNNLDVNVLAMLDARMHELYWGFFTTNTDVVEQVSAPCDVKISSTKPLLIAGVGFKPYIQALPDSVRVLCIEQQLIFPQALTMIRLVQAGSISGMSAAEAMPVYLRNQVTGHPKGGAGG